MSRKCPGLSWPRPNGTSTWRRRFRSVSMRWDMGRALPRRVPFLGRSLTRLYTPARKHVRAARPVRLKGMLQLLKGMLQELPDTFSRLAGTFSRLPGTFLKRKGTLKLLPDPFPRLPDPFMRLPDPLMRLPDPFMRRKG